MYRRIITAFTMVCALPAHAVAAPILTPVAVGLLGGNWVWQIDITPDLVLAGGSTSMAVELGFRLTGSPLVSATIGNSTAWDTANPGNVIFGWETLTDLDPGPGTNLKPVGLQTNPPTSEVFIAYGSSVLATPVPRTLLQITALGPGNGGSNSSTIQWLGRYGIGSSFGRIGQSLAAPGSAQNFDIYAGSATQIPEPASGVLIALSAVFAACFKGRNRG